MSLDFITHLSVDEGTLLSELGLVGLSLHRKQAKDSVIWMLESQLDRDRPLSDHVGYLCSLFHNSKVTVPSDIIKEIYLDIGVLYNSVTCTLSLSNVILSALTEVFPHSGIEITCYPSEDI